MYILYNTRTKQIQHIELEIVEKDGVQYLQSANPMFNFLLIEDENLKMAEIKELTEEHKKLYSRGKLYFINKEITTKS